MQDIVLIANRKKGYDDFLLKLQEAMRCLPPKGVVPAQAGLEVALETNLVNAAAVATMLRGQLG